MKLVKDMFGRPIDQRPDFGTGLLGDSSINYGIDFVLSIEPTKTPLHVICEGLAACEILLRGVAAKHVR